MGECYASKVIDVARNEIGYLEKKSNKNLDDKTANAGYNNYNKYAKLLDSYGYFYNGKKNGYAWCDCFVDAVFVMAYGVDNALRLLCQPKRSYGAGVKYSRNYYKKKKRLFKDPKPGDQIFFWKNGKLLLAHTGLVVDVDDKYVYTVEGNTSRNRGVVSNGGGAWDKKYKLKYSLIAGYGRPDYDPEPVTEMPELSAPAPVLKPGAGIGDTVKLKSGAKQYNGKGLASFVYKRKHKVKEVTGNRAVITYGGITVAAVNCNDLEIF